jgi:hypothetical protein
VEQKKTLSLTTNIKTKKKEEKRSNSETNKFFVQVHICVPLYFGQMV